MKHVHLLKDHDAVLLACSNARIAVHELKKEEDRLQEHYKDLPEPQRDIRWAQHELYVEMVPLITKET